MGKDQELKGYYIIRPVSEGAWKITYRAYDLVVDRRVALKRYKKLSKEKLEGLWQREGLDMEAMRHRDVLPMKLSHPNIMPCSWTYDDEGNFCIIEPWLDMTLERLVAEKGCLSHNKFMLYARGIAAGLSHCHKYGVIHGDIKMDNIGIKDNKAVLCDFGIASVLSPRRRKRYNPSTIRTRAPELFAKGVSINEKSDIWAVGCVFFAMLTGQYPFIGKAEQIPAWDQKGARKEFEQKKQEEILGGVPALHNRIKNEISELYWEVVKSSLQYDPAARVSARGLAGVLRQTAGKIRKCVEAMKREHELVRNLQEHGALTAWFRYYIEAATSHYEIEWPSGGDTYSFFPGENVTDYLPFVTFEEQVNVTPEGATEYSERQMRVRLSNYAKEILKILR